MGPVKYANAISMLMSETLILVLLTHAHAHTEMGRRVLKSCIRMSSSIIPYTLGTYNMSKASIAYTEAGNIHAFKGESKKITQLSFH